MDLPIPALFQHPTVVQLAVALDKAQHERMDALIAHVEQLSDDEVARLLREKAE